MNIGKKTAHALAWQRKPPPLAHHPECNANAMCMPPSRLRSGGRKQGCPARASWRSGRCL
eukprot:10170926-Alexandrium_andersonii.AAC.1